MCVFVIKPCMRKEKKKNVSYMYVRANNKSSRFGIMCDIIRYMHPFHLILSSHISSTCFIYYFN